LLNCVDRTSYTGVFDT